jgi:hypothetical protein
LKYHVAGGKWDLNDTANPAINFSLPCNLPELSPEIVRKLIKPEGSLKKYLAITGFQ